MILLLRMLGFILINKNYILIICLLTILFSFEDKIDINNATYDELLSIPIDSGKISHIHQYINYSGKISTIYELLNIEKINSKDFDILKKYTFINKNFIEKEYSYKVIRLLNEDASGDNNISNNLSWKIYTR